MNTNERIKIFKSLMGQVFGKEDVDYFVATLKRMGYFTAPASTKYHGNYEGGLFDHSLEVNLEHMKKELGDCLWMIAEACNALGTDIDTVMQMNIDKLKARYPEGFTVENSLHRKPGDI